MSKANGNRKTRSWITWETQPRNHELSTAFDCEYAHFDYSSQPSIVRYLYSLARTLPVLFACRGGLVFVQCPSIILAAAAVLCRRIGGYRLVIDAHNAALEYADSSNRLLRSAARRCLSSADHVIVTNEGLASAVREMGGRPLILMDKPPTLGSHCIPQRFEPLPRPLVTLIATFAADEPIETFLEAFSGFDHSMTLIVTGRRSKAGELLDFESDRIIFSDFLSSEDYDGLIGHSDLVVDLTTRENCLVCGAYEALSAGTPGILSDTEALRTAFPGGFLFAENTVESYRSALQQFSSEPNRYSNDITAALAEFNERWREQFRHVLKAIGLEISPD